MDSINLRIMTIVSNWFGWESERMATKIKAWMHVKRYSAAIKGVKNFPFSSITRWVREGEKFNFHKVLFNWETINLRVRNLILEKHSMSREFFLTSYEYLLLRMELIFYASSSQRFLFFSERDAAVYYYILFL